MDANDWWKKHVQNEESFFGSTSTPTETAPSNSGFFGGLAHDVGSVVHGAEDVGKAAGSFFGGIASNIATDAVNTAKTVKNIGQAVYTNINAPKNIAANQKMLNQATTDYNNGKISLEQLNQTYSQYQKTSQALSKQISNEGILTDKESAGQQAASAGNTFINAATLGIGGGVKALAEGGAKDIIKAGSEDGVGGAIKKGAQVLASNGQSTPAREAFSDAIAGGGKPAVQAAVAHFGNEAAANAAIGGAQGGLNAVQNEKPGSPSDFWSSALKGAVVGGAVGAGGALLDKDVRAGIAEAPGVAREGAAKAGAALRGATPLNEAGGVRIPGGSDLERPGNAVPSTDSGNPDVQSPQLSRELTPDEQSKAQLAQDVAQHYSSPTQYIKETADHAYQFDKGQTGGQIQRTANATGQDSFTRTTSHTPFYSDFYKAMGHAPSKTDYADQIQTALEKHTDGGGIIDPAEGDVYSILKDREASDQALTTEPSATHEVTRQRYLSAIDDNEAPMGTATSKAAATPPPESTETPVEVPPPSGANRQRGFFDTVKNSSTSTPELKKAVGKTEPQTYVQSSNPELAQRAKDIVDNDPVAAHNRILSNTDPSDEDVAVGMQLMGKYQQQGKMDDAVSIADKLDTELRAHGRAVQAASIWGRLTPEGTLRFAAKKLREGREVISNGRRFEKGVGSEKKVAGETKAAIEKSTQATRDDINKAVKDTIKGKGKSVSEDGEQEELSTGEKVAKRVEKTVTPKVKKQADQLVNELTKKIKQEMLPEKSGAAKKSPLNILREVFGRNDEAQEAFPEAQRILRQKFADNPKAQEALDKFFNSELGIPSASSTMNAAIKDQLTQNQTKIGDIIQKSYHGQTTAVKDIADALTKEGFDANSAQVISKEVTDRLNTRISEAKQKVLQRLSKDVPKRALPTFTDKINKLGNLGALTDADYLQLARAKLDLPQLTPDIAKDIFTMSQKLQDMPEGAERDQLTKQLLKRVSDAIPKTKAQLAAELISAPKAVMASFDLSGTLRQGGVLGARFKSEAKSAFAKQVKYFKSEKAFDEGMSAIKQDPLYETANRANIALTGVDGSEEAFVSQLPEKIPLFGKGIQASDRAYTGGLTELRFNAFKHIASDLRAEGIDITKFDDKQLESIGKFINTASGRGYGDKAGLFEKVAPALNRTLFSPRLWKSRLDMLNPMYYAKLDPIARKYALQAAGSFAGIAGVVLGLASLAGAQVGTDPRSSDFLKIKVGDTRYDILGGFQQNLVFAYRELSGQYENSSTGAITDLNSGNFDSPTRMSILSDLVQNKENPVISTGSDLLNGTNSLGQPVNPKTELAKLFIPLNLQDTYTLSKSSDPLSALFGATVPGTLGVGVSTYGPNTPSSSTASGPGTFSQFSTKLAGQ